jgi:CheY-like chemotaxis protein
LDEFIADPEPPQKGSSALFSISGTTDFSPRLSLIVDKHFSFSSANTARIVLLSDSVTVLGWAMRILLVEDHRDTRQVLVGLLTRWGYIVSAAETLKSGLDLLESEPPVDVILSDIALPDGTGYALVSEARRRGKPVLAIALSGYAYPSDVHIAKLTGFDHHLTKPCDCGYLRTILKERSEWDHHREP